MDDAEHLKAGTMIAGYRVLEKLGEGSMSVLYRVAAPGGESPRLLKVPKLGFGSHPACYAAFESEQMILERLGGPHVPRLYTSGDDILGPYMVIEYVAGTSLAVHARLAPLPGDEVARLGASLAAAIHELHRQDVVHHDLKPSHVILRDDGRATLIDFGLAVHHLLPDLVAAESDRPLGTPAYIAPETLAGVRGDSRSDVFSLGVMLYLLATGRLPFGEPASNIGLRRRRYFDPRPPRRIRPELDVWLQEIILHCLEIDVSARYATAAQVAHDLIHPDQVTITERASRSRGTGFRTMARRWLASMTASKHGQSPEVALLSLAPNVLVAVDTTSCNEALLRAMRQTVQRIVAGETNWRVSCVNVLEPSALTDQEEGDEILLSLRTQRLVELHHWAQALGLPREHIRFHVLHGGDAARCLIEHARATHVDHIVMGARGGSGWHLLGSVSTRVAAEAPCTVTVVRGNVSAQTKTPD